MFYFGTRHLKSSLSAPKSNGWPPYFQPCLCRGIVPCLSSVESAHIIQIICITVRTACCEGAPSQPRCFIHSPYGRPLWTLKYLQKEVVGTQMALRFPLSWGRRWSRWLFSVAQNTFVYSLRPVLGAAPKSHVGSEQGIYFWRYRTFQILSILSILLRGK